MKSSGVARCGFWVGRASRVACAVAALLAAAETSRAQVVFEVDTASSGVKIDVQLRTDVGNDRDRDSTGLAGSVTALLSGGTIHLTDGSFVFRDSLHLSFSFGGIVPLGSITADASAEAVSLDLITPGAPSMLDAGSFAQSENEVALQGVLHLDGTGLVGGAVPSEPQEIDVRSTMTLSGTLAVEEGVYELTLPIDFRGTFDLGSATAIVSLDGVIHGSAALPVAVEHPQPLRSVLGTVYPSPAHSTATISFELERAGAVQLDLYDLHGRRVQAVTSGFLAAGPHDVSVDLSRLPSGLYFVSLTTESIRETTRLVVVR